MSSDWGSVENIFPVSSMTNVWYLCEKYCTGIASESRTKYITLSLLVRRRTSLTNVTFLRETIQNHQGLSWHPMRILRRKD